MKRRTLRSLLAIALLAIVAGFIASSRSASAQGPIFWCGVGCYTIDATQLANFPNCLLCIRTSWNNGGVVWPAPGAACSYFGGGLYKECPVPVQPVGSPLDWVEICGNILPAVDGQYTIPANPICPGCPPLCVRLCMDAIGCLVIKIYPGPCPGPILPCP